MRIQLLSLFLAPLISASSEQPPNDSPRNSITWPPAPPPTPSRGNASIPSPTLASDPVASHNFQQQIPNHLAQFLLSFGNDAPSDAEDLRKRQQGGVGGGNGAPPASIPTQLSPVTVYWDGTSQATYTQLFSPTPVPWSQPNAGGQIGMGTLTGTYGVVKSAR